MKRVNQIQPAVGIHGKKDGEKNTSEFPDCDYQEMEFETKIILNLLGVEDKIMKSY